MYGKLVQTMRFTDDVAVTAESEGELAITC